MKNASPTFHYQEIMQNLQDYCENKNSGTLFITTTNNHSIRFVLKQGIIVFLAYRFKQGKDALPLIKKIESGVFSFKKDTFAGKDDPTLLDTDTILNALSNKKTPPKSNNKTKAKKELVSKMLIISDDDIDKIKTELALFIGPVDCIEVLCCFFRGRKCCSVEFEDNTAIKRGLR